MPQQHTATVVALGVAPAAFWAWFGRGLRHQLRPAAPSRPRLASPDSLKAFRYHPEPGRPHLVRPRTTFSLTATTAEFQRLAG